jgi:hypothetical protein
VIKKDGKTTRVAIIGSHGLGATYGGWDFLVHCLSQYHSADIALWIFNSRDTPAPAGIPSGVRVTRLHLKADGFQGLFYDFYSIARSVLQSETLLLLGAQGMPLVAILRAFSRTRVVVNLGGMEWERPKFSGPTKWYLQWCARLSLSFAHSTVIDNPHFRALLPTKNNSQLEIIPYAGQIDTSLSVSPALKNKYPFLGQAFLLCVARALEDNLLEELCGALANTKHHLVLISTFGRTEYGRRVHKKYRNMANFTLIDGVWDKKELDLIRRNCTAYIHTHTLCGSAPSLIEMIVAQKPIFSADVPQNRYTLENSGAYFTACSELPDILSSYDGRFEELVPPGSLVARYTPSAIVDAYEAVFRGKDNIGT